MTKNMKKSIDEIMSALIDFISDTKVNNEVICAYYLGCMNTIVYFLNSKEDFETIELLVKICDHVENMGIKPSRNKLLNDALEIKEMLTPNEKFNANDYFKTK